MEFSETRTHGERGYERAGERQGHREHGGVQLLADLGRLLLQGVAEAERFLDNPGRFGAASWNARALLAADHRAEPAGPHGAVGTHLRWAPSGGGQGAGTSEASQRWGETDDLRRRRPQVCRVEGQAPRRLRGTPKRIDAWVRGSLIQRGLVTEDAGGLGRGGGSRGGPRRRPRGDRFVRGLCAGASCQVGNLQPTRK